MWIVKSDGGLATAPNGTKYNQSTESADGGGCLKFYKPLELIGKDPFRCLVSLRLALYY